ncbi:MAG: helix-turn-helix transcriptional regulator [Mucilaginibacter polytrichastri]|nr:helix-turn-helix transcriptional regulator [Mucilaginibacter polytrichastri]
MKHIGEKIRMKRLSKNYSQEYMAFNLEISQAAYSKLERGETEISVSRTYEIAELLECSPQEFMPKPRYGQAIHLGHAARTLRKLKHFWLSRLRQRQSPRKTG